MPNRSFLVRAIAAALLAAGLGAAHAQVRITEVAPWSSGNSAVNADWFELTNTGSSAVNITGWKVDDGSATFAAAATLNGISSIGAGESVIFIETASDATLATFRSHWFGASAPAGLKVGRYSGSGLGLGTGGDGVTVFNATGTLMAKVTFGASASGPFATFDNAAGLDNTTISTLAAVGVNGAFAAVNSANEIGSPGLVAAPVPEPETWGLMAAGLALVGAVARRRKA